MFTDSRLLPASGAFPTPGTDISGTIWQQYMRPGEIALFTFDAKTGQPLTTLGKVADSAVNEHCVAFRSLYMARRAAKGGVFRNPGVITVLYDQRGRWLTTWSREGEERRNLDLGLAWLLFQFPLLAFLGTLLIFIASFFQPQWFGGEPLHWKRMSPEQLLPIASAGLLLGGVGRLLFELGRWSMLALGTHAARQPVGSPGRDAFYEKLARANNPNLLVPLDITFTPTIIDWPSPEKYAQWTEVLGREGFEHLGAYSIREASAELDFWFHSELDLTATISKHPQAGMWLNVFTRYEDGSSFGTSNKDAPPVDQHATKRTHYLGRDASAEQAIQTARDERSAFERHHVTGDNVLPDYAKGWREHVEWLRARGTTAEEFKRVAEAKARAKAAGTSWL